MAKLMGELGGLRDGSEAWGLARLVEVDQAGYSRTDYEEAAMSIDAIVLLKEDHRKVEKLFKQFEKAGGKAFKEKRKLVDAMIEELTTHTYIEEEIFYPVAKEAVPETRDHVLESVEEHHVMVWLMAELRDLDPQDETFDAKVTVLTENVRHHVEEEEDEWFPEVRKALGRKRLQEVGQRMLDARPDAPDDPLKIASAHA
ncbi:hemerythrin [Amycolatopsis sp. NBRC 101858]|uniref:hemerythrin domain-containing protein n=1 Tax=Amycolatopsis sp. NBRC 101858 TaxID=3032200 RepID=UPI0024A12B57|nr:hemerythrin domain-containing protein [Amycolatopsis sp. NBRC 101858]GLY42923.1 hemerythrin [Amycolatopsis sp. NBRC 101858]